MDILRVVAIALAISTVVPAAVGAEPQVVRLGYTANPGSLYDLTAIEFAKRVGDALKGKVEVKPGHSSQFGTDEQMIKGIKASNPEMFLPSTIMSTVSQKFGVFEMPYLIVSRAHMKTVAEHPEVQKALFESLPRQGMRVIAVWENGYRHITDNVRPVARPDDLREMKIRVPSGAWRVRMFKAYGANPVPMPFNEVYPALQMGGVDGQENPLSQIWSGKFYEVQKYLALSGHVYTPAYLTVSEAFWQKLPLDQRQAIEKIALEMGDYARSTGEKLDKELVGKMTAASKLKVNEVDKEAFIKASAAVYQDFGKDVSGGAELVKLIQSLR